MNITIEYQRTKTGPTEDLSVEIPDTLPELVRRLGERRCIYLLQEGWRDGLQAEINKSVKQGADREYLENQAKNYFPGADMPTPPAEKILALTEENICDMTADEFKRLYDIVREASIGRTAK